MYQRVVCIKFRQDVSEEAIQEHMTSFQALQKAIPQIAAYRAGRIVGTGNGHLPGYDSVHYLTFSNDEDLERYYRHQAHQRFVKDHEALWDDVLVLNATVDEW